MFEKLEYFIVKNPRKQILPFFFSFQRKNYSRVGTSLNYLLFLGNEYQLLPSERTGRTPFCHLQNGTKGRIPTAGGARSGSGKQKQPPGLAAAGVLRGEKHGVCVRWPRLRGLVVLLLHGSCYLQTVKAAAFIFCPERRGTEQLAGERGSARGELWPAKSALSWDTWELFLLSSPAPCHGAGLGARPPVLSPPLVLW